MAIILWITICILFHERNFMNNYMYFIFMSAILWITICILFHGNNFMDKYMYFISWQSFYG